MTDRDESDQPRKRIAVACGRCRKRKIRCSGDPGNGGPCSNCKNAGHEPCLFLRVSSQETHLKDGGDYHYNLEVARNYANHQTRGAVSPLQISQYTHDIATGDGLAPYRPNLYTYNNSTKGYQPAISGWTGNYPDDGSVDYGLTYASYTNQESAPLVPGYSHQYSTRKTAYIDPETPSYSYGNLVHRPAVNNDSQGFSLSSIAASLPNTSERILSSDRLHSSVNRTLTSPSNYRSDGISAYSYSGNSKSSSSSTVPDVAYSNIQPPFENIYPTPSTLSPPIAHRASGNADSSAYPPGAATAAEQLYSPSDHTIRSTEDGSTGLSYVYSDSKLSSSRRDSHSGGGISTGPLLSNGHVYVPDSHAATAAHPYIVPGVSVSSAQGRGLNGASAPVGHGEASSVPVPVAVSGSVAGTSRPSVGGSVGGSGTSTSASSTSGSSHRPSDSHRRSAGSLRGI